MNKIKLIESCETFLCIFYEDVSIFNKEYEISKIKNNL